MPEQTFQKVVNAERLAEELVAAIPALTPVPVSGDLVSQPLVLNSTATAVRVTTPTGTDQATVAAVVGAHDPAVQTAAQQQQAADDAEMEAFHEQTQTILTRLDQIMAQMQGPPNPTTAQIAQAVRDLANCDKHTVKMVERLSRSLA